MAHSHSVAPPTDSHAPESAAQAPGRSVASTPTPFSLLRMSALDRLLGASVVVALLWVGVYWALH
jgi:hypothetical protein